MYMYIYMYMYMCAGNAITDTVAKAATANAKAGKISDAKVTRLTLLCAAHCLLMQYSESHVVAREHAAWWCNTTRI